MRKIFTTLLFLALISSAFGTTQRYRLMFNDDPATIITVGWEQVSGTNPKVYYGTADHGTNWASYPDSMTVHKTTNYMGMTNKFAKLIGLTPNTAYYFVIKDSDGTSARYWFKTCPNVNTEKLSFVSGGDSRSGRTQRQNSNLMVAKIRPHAVLFGGDLVNTPSISSVQDWFDDWQLTITSDSQMIPVVHSFGNHEEYGTGGPEFISELFDTPYDVYYKVTFGGNLFSVYTLNGELLPGHTIANNTKRTAQRNWLSTTLASDGAIWKSAQYHRPMVPHESGKGEGADEFNDWANLFYTHDVRLVMESDAHVTKVTENVMPTMATASGNSNTWFTTAGIPAGKGINFIGEGAWGTIRTDNDPHPFTLGSTSMYQFAWITVSNCKIEVRTIDTQNPGGVPEHSATDLFSISAGLDAQIWKPAGLPSGVLEIIKCYAPDAEFSASATAVLTGQNINFTDLSTNTPTSWLWDFGDGNTSTAQNPSHSYASPGTYTVVLTATNADGSGTETKVAYIVVSAPAPPVADFTANDVTPALGQTINFTDNTANLPTGWSWNFGDGNISTAQNPSHSYAAAGTYTVTLTATNAFGSDTETKTNYITVTNGGSVSVTISNGNDDVEEWKEAADPDYGDLYMTSSDLEIGNDAGWEQYVGLRFQNISVPQGAIITNAKIRFRADESDAFSSQMNIYIAGEDVDSASQFNNSSQFNLSGRTFTTNQYTWAIGTVPAWSSGNIYDTPNISTVIQEIVNRPGWSLGNAMVFMLWSDAGESSERVADSYEGGYPAELIFDWVMPAPPLSIELTNFSAKALNNKIVLLEWTTKNEINNDYFTVMRSKDGKSWQELQQVKGAGNSSVILDYSSLDLKPYMGVSYYQLKQTDFDGTQSFSQIEEVKIIEDSEQSLNVYPNPTTNEITVEGFGVDLTKLVIYNAAGQNVTSNVLKTTIDDSKVKLDLKPLAKGLYFIGTDNNFKRVYKLDK